jgi:hypothetical protein
MKLPKNWLTILGLSLSLPSTILAMAWGLFKLSESGIIPTWLAATLLFLSVAQILFLMVYYAVRKKN